MSVGASDGQSEAVKKWNEYATEQNRKHAAEVAAGRSCSRCGRWITIIGGGPGYKRECHSCEKRHEDGEFAHEKYLRCPSCRHTWDPWDSEDVSDEFLSEGSHDVTCGMCEHTFEVETEVSYHFTSPEMRGADADEDTAEVTDDEPSESSPRDAPGTTAAGEAPPPPPGGDDGHRGQIRRGFGGEEAAGGDPRL